MKSPVKDKPKIVRDSLIYKDGEWLLPLGNGFFIISPEFLDMTHKDLSREFARTIAKPKMTTPLYEAYGHIIPRYQKDP